MSDVDSDPNARRPLSLRVPQLKTILGSGGYLALLLAAVTVGFVPRCGDYVRADVQKERDEAQNAKIDKAEAAYEKLEKKIDAGFTALQERLDNLTTLVPPRRRNPSR